MTVGRRDTGSADESAGALRRLAEEVFRPRRDVSPGRAGLRRPLESTVWSALEETGLGSLSLPEELGGGGGTLAQLALVLREAGRAGAGVPVVESQLLGGWLLQLAGLRPPEGTLTCALDGGLTVSRSNGTWSVRGVADAVAWGADCRWLVAPVTTAVGPAVALMPSDLGTWSRGFNLAGEGRDRCSLDADPEEVAGAPTAVEVVELGVDPADELRWRAALGRSCLMVGALERTQQLTVEYVKQRQQFGRPLGSFQTVQHQVAQLAGAVRAGAVAVDAAVDRAGDGFLEPGAVAAIAAAKLEVNGAARRVARSAHQLHGAIGITDEYPLHAATLRLWAWSQEDGADPELQDELGRLVEERGSVWRLIVDTERPAPSRHGEVVGR